MLVNKQETSWGIIYNIMDENGYSFCRLSDFGTFLFISDLNVIETERGKGLGKTIMLFVLNLAKQLRPKISIELNVKKGNWVVKWYKRLGFKIDKSYKDVSNWRMYLK